MDLEFDESSVNHLVYTITSPILRNFIGKKKVAIVFSHEPRKEIVSTDSETVEEVEFIIVDRISEEKYIFIIKGKRSSVGNMMRQFLMAMKELRDTNCKGKVYGFVTTGDVANARIRW